jgi:hypothetical protein
MAKRTSVFWMLTWAFVSLFPPGASAQIVEAVGSRALGMGGAFVAVASDNSAVWWNPAGLAAGPFVDMGFSRAVVEGTDTLPGARDRVSGFALATPAIGISYYRLQVTDIRPGTPTDSAGNDREDITADVSLRSFSIRQFGVTLVQTLLPGVHAGATLKYLRGSTGTGAGNGSLAVADLLDQGEGLDRGGSEGHFDLDVGVLATAGVARVGAVVKNLRQPEFGGGEWQLPRQIRIGAAVALEDGGGPPLTIALDADVRAYRSGTGDRRVLAVGAEDWVMNRRLGLRAGARFNRAGAREHAVTGGASVAVRSGLYLEAHVVGGGAADERGWGAAARVTF